MRKIISILFASLILVSGLHISIARHFCGGEGEAFKKISLTGELASCGMEDDHDQSTLPGIRIKAHCCDDEVSVLAVDNNYAPSFSEFRIFSQPVSQAYLLPVNSCVPTALVFNRFGTNVFPPGNSMASSVNLADICVFRI